MYIHFSPEMVKITYPYPANVENMVSS